MSSQPARPLTPSGVRRLLPRLALRSAVVTGLLASPACDLALGSGQDRGPASSSELDELLPRDAPDGSTTWRRASQLESRWRSSGNYEHLEAALSAYKTVRDDRRCEGVLRAAAITAEHRGDPEPLRAQAQAILDPDVGLQVDAACKAAARKVLATAGSSLAEPGADVPTTELPGASNWSSKLQHGPEGATSRPLEVTKIERYGSPDSARLVVFLTEPAVYQVGQLPQDATRGPRLYVDIDGADYQGKPELPVGGIVEQVRLGRGDEGVRVVLDLRERVYQHIFYLPEPFRLVIDVSKNPPRLAPSPERGGRAVQRVVLDPGHGGHDPGAVGSSGLQEKDVALDVGLRAAPLIARELGISTLLTRDTDHFVPLAERVAKANAFGADLFISIHCNASESSRSHGVMTFILDESPDPIAQQIAARENAASEGAGSRLATAMRQVMGDETLRRSAHFAQLLQRSSVASLLPAYPDVRDGGVRRAGFYVLAGAQMPAVLFEASFISNHVEERRLDSARYRQKLADALVNAVRAYRDGR